MSIEDLMKPRYKVIADYPKSLYHVGDILNAGWRSEDCIYCDTDGPRWRHFPHLFKPLAWWEERKPEDMPGYIKDKEDGNVYKIVKKLNKEGHLYLIENQFEMANNAHIKYFVPATESEYNEFTKPE